MNLDSAQQDDFAATLGTLFLVNVGGREVTMELEEVRSLGHRRSGATREPFALMFCAHGAEIIPQGTYPVSHPQLGGFDLFIVPVGRSPGGVNYEAIFT